MEGQRKYDLEDRLVKFAILALEVCDLLPNTKAGQNLEHQLSKSGTVPALLYGEAQGAESRADFIHKMKMLLKELRESKINLRIIIEKPLIAHEKVNTTLQECNELIGIFTASIQTAKSNKV
ncbi:four helix bundle protein [Flavisolibacter ginsenosidimutans]|uniref:Four helix bundle protein n=1 Tax=Flavisolibacter ginsenosidimutans TaxID=661481 RepID=A0A5B8UID0_9BACT|nr:four helix bundle protein [Flavisolibacter ginsenosidimutans]QEC56192.1 four helix bundle protein [Flavisolibacter ginsenosidimutans]